MNRLLITNKSLLAGHSLFKKYGTAEQEFQCLVALTPSSS